MNWIKKYNDWSKQPLDYNFNLVFSLVVVIYFVSVMFDFCLTYITFTLSPDGFFRNEFNFLIKETLNGNVLFCLFIIIIIVLPLAVTYAFNMHSKRLYGYSANGIRVCFYAIHGLSFVHIYGGFTNFFQLINLKV